MPGCAGAWASDLIALKIAVMVGMGMGLLGMREWVHYLGMEILKIKSVSQRVISPHNFINLDRDNCIHIIDINKIRHTLLPTEKSTTEGIDQGLTYTRIQL